MEEEVTLKQIAEVVFVYLISWKVQLGQIREQDMQRVLDDALANLRRSIEIANRFPLYYLGCKDGVAK